VNVIFTRAELAEGTVDEDGSLIVSGHVQGQGGTVVVRARPNVAAALLEMADQRAGFVSIGPVDAADGDTEIIKVISPPGGNQDFCCRAFQMPSAMAAMTTRANRTRTERRAGPWDTAWYQDCESA